MISIKNKIINHYIFLLSISLVFIFGIHYLSKSTINIPIMDYWSYFDAIGESTLSGTMTFSDYWGSTELHRNPLTFLMLQINILLFNWNTLIEIYLGKIITIITVIIFYIYYNKSLIKKCNVYTQLLFIPIILLMTALNKWEIITLQFSLVFSIRLLCFLLIFICFDYLLLNKRNICIKKYLLLALFIFVCILFLSQAYFFALIASIIIIIFLDNIFNYKVNKNIQYLNYSIILISIIIGTLIYMEGLTISNGDSSLIESIINIISSGILFDGIITMLGSSLLHQNINYEIVFVLGSLIMILTVISIIFYFYKRMYKISYMPLLLIIYAYFNIGMIIYSRSSLSLSYLTSSRYSYDTVMCVLGIYLIYMIYNQHYLDKVNKVRYKNISQILIIIMFSIPVIITDYIEYEIAPYRKINFNRAKEILLNIDMYSDDDLEIFQANSIEIVRNAAIIMDENNLSVFNDNYGITKSDEINTGVHTDGWVEEEATLYYESSENGEIYLECYYPRDIKGFEIISIYVNNEYYIDYSIENSSFTIELEDLTPNREHEIKIITNFAEKYIERDERKLSFVIVDIY